MAIQRYDCEGSGGMYFNEDSGEWVCYHAHMEIVNKLKELETNKIMLKHFTTAVQLFHSTFKIPFNTKLTGEIPKERYELRHELMREENDEYLEAAKNNDSIEVADALGDMLYILCGTIIEHGMQDKIEEVFNEIQRSNMSKLGEDGKPIYREDGKVLKGTGYFKPNIKSILEK